MSDWSTRRNSAINQGSESLAELFGYFEDSESNTMALVRKVSRSFLLIYPMTSKITHLF